MVQFIRGNKRLPIVIAAALACVLLLGCGQAAADSEALYPYSDVSGLWGYINRAGEVVNVQPAN